MKIFKSRWPRWRIVTDGWKGFEVQVREGFWKPWKQCCGEEGKRVNTFHTLEEARKWAATKPMAPPPYHDRSGKVVEVCDL